MLKQRVVTAVWLLLILIPTLFYPAPEPFIGLAMLMVGAAGWEWGRLNGLASTGSLGLGLATVLTCALVGWMGWVHHAPLLLWLVGSSIWVLGGSWLLISGADGWRKLPRDLRLVLGLTVLVLAWLALAQARRLGVNFLLSLLVLVWVADIFAYFAGRAFGRRKLAPAISPGKSWEGVWGAMAGVVVLSIAWTMADRQWAAEVPSLYSQLAAKGQVLLWLSLVYLVAMSVIGDLIESLVKRSAGVKDSSGLLPGHGGVLDRIDALLPTLPAGLMLVSLGGMS